WKGYGPEDDTWEPIESFDESEEVIEAFWERVNSGGRDFRDISKFKLGEIFVQTGPPRRKRKRQNQDLASSATTSPTKQEEPRQTTKHEEHADSDKDKRPKKRSKDSDVRPRGVATTIDSPVSVSDKGNRNGTNKTPHTVHKVISSPPARRHRVTRRVTSPDTVSPSEQEENDDSAVFDVGLFGSPIEPAKELHDDSPSPSKNNTSLLKKPAVPSPPSLLPIVKKPLHRSSKPLIKLVDDPQMEAMEGAITVKARLMGRNTSTANANETSNQASGARMQPLRSKPGPGRSSIGLKKNTSSLLTFEKGALKTVKGKYTKDKAKKSESAASDDLPQADPPDLNVELPTASELLDLAGLDSQTPEPLPSYESVAPVDEEIPSENASELQVRRDNNTMQVNVLYICDNLLPASSSIGVPQTSSPAIWKRSTIFDPLIRGPDPEDEKDLPSKVPGSVPFRLNLDHSFSITVHLSSASTPSLDSPAASRTITRPGAFYKGNYAFDICKTIHTVGSSGFVTMAFDAKDEDKKHFQRFCDRLCDGELFIVPAGIEVLAFWSVENVALTQGLNIDPIPDVQGKVLFSKIIVDNYSEYSEIVTYADPVPWLQYMEKHQ
ncbi:hypothetical protein M378DRAFT_68823, partial [Amanita muscaria Koide BX008]